MNKSTAVLLTVAIATVWAFIATNDEDSPTSATAVSTNSTWAEPEIAASISSSIDSGFSLDIERLYDISYESDPYLVDFSRSINKKPGCVLAIVKRQIDGVELSGQCDDSEQGRRTNALVLLPGAYETVCKDFGGSEQCRRIKVADHPYEQYTNQELQSLASVSPEAAIILARRIPDNALSEQYYEQAVALSGRPGPLEEWMLHRNLGGLVHIGGALDLDKAKLGYEIYLTTARLGYGIDAVAEYERVLTEANVDLGPIQQKADARYTRLTIARRSIVGNEWGG